jgi:hypothetical protein
MPLEGPGKPGGTEIIWNSSAVSLMLMSIYWVII